MFLYGVAGLTERKKKPDAFKNYLKMTDDSFRYLSTLVSLVIKKKDPVIRKSISAEERLTATLRFLTGRSQVFNS